MTWNEMNKAERVSAIKGLLVLDPRLRDQDLADRLNISRDSISLCIRENKIQRPLSGGDKRRKRPAPVRKPHGLVFGKPVSDLPTLPRDVNAKAFQPLAGAPAPKRLWEIERNECHWPVGQDPAVFCGCATDESGRYCARHTKMSGKQVPRLVFA